MDYSSYLRVLLSVWVGLGLGQLVQALHRLARFKGTVKWDWLPIVWAGFAFLMFVQTWWAYFTVLQSPLWVNLFAFVLPLTVFVVLYLICASALPDVSKATEGAVVDLQIAGIGAAVALAWSTERRLHVVVTLVALAALILYIVLFSLRLA
jgi:hypothetical protein